MTDEEYAAALVNMRCSRCPAISVARVTTERGGKERVCATCLWGIEFDEAEEKAKDEADLRAALAERRPKAMTNMERVNRMCVAFGLEPYFKATPAKKGSAK